MSADVVISGALLEYCFANRIKLSTGNKDGWWSAEWANAPFYCPGQTAFDAVASLAKVVDLPPPADQIGDATEKVETPAEVVLMHIKKDLEELLDRMDSLAEWSAKQSGHTSDLLASVARLQNLIDRCPSCGAPQCCPRCCPRCCEESRREGVRQEYEQSQRSGMAFTHAREGGRP